MKSGILFIAAATLMLASCAQKNDGPVDFVNPNIGGISPLLETTVPLVNLPNSMMRIHRIPGNYQAEKIKGFPFILCGHRNGTAGLLMPSSGKQYQQILNCGKVIMIMIMRCVLLIIILFGLKIRILIWSLLYQKNPPSTVSHGIKMNRKT